MKDDTYNGFSNWETWVVNLWMDNDSELYGHYGEMAHTEVSKDKERAVFKLSLILQAEFVEWMPEWEGVYMELLSGAMTKVNWHQVARHLVERVEEEENHAKSVN